jgi:hypothetical protein
MRQASEVDGSGGRDSMECGDRGSPACRAGRCRVFGVDDDRVVVIKSKPLSVDAAQPGWYR